MFKQLIACYKKGGSWLARWLGPTVLLSMRIWVAIAFWRAGLVKIEDPTGTQFLFNTVYQVPHCCRPTSPQCSVPGSN